MRYSRRGRIENKVRQEALARMRQPKVSHRKAWVRVLVFVGLVVLCGVAINRPRKPQPLSRPQDVVLPYHVASSKDISYAGSRRLVRRVVLDVATRPEEPELRATATAIWTPDRNRWDEFTVFLYLPDMDTQSMAYAVAEYTPAGSAAFRVQEFALRGTRWKKTADPPEPPPRPMPDAREYHIDLDVTVGDDRALHISAATNYPDGAMLHVSAGRSYYERDQPDAYWGEYESRDIAVKNGHISATVVADDNIWYDAYQRSAREFAGLILYSGIDRQTISGMVTVRVLFSPARSQPADVLARIRRDGKASSYTVE